MSIRTAFVVALSLAGAVISTAGCSSSDDQLPPIKAGSGGSAGGKAAGGKAAGGASAGDGAGALGGESTVEGGADGAGASSGSPTEGGAPVGLGVGGAG